MKKPALISVVHGAHAPPAGAKNFSPLHRRFISATPGRRAQSGAAMVEFIVGAMLVLVPLFLAIQAMGKFADVKHMAQAGARYAAWERTVWVDSAGSAFYRVNGPIIPQKTDAQIRSEIAVRLFNNRNSALVYSDNDKNRAGFGPGGMDPLWEDTAGQAYLTSYANVTLGQNTLTPANDPLGNVLDTVNAVRVPNVDVGGSLAPPVSASNTLVQATFGLNAVASASNVYQRLWSIVPGGWTGLNVSGRAAVLNNAWNANGSGGTRAMVQPSVPTAQGLGVALRAVTAPILAWEPNVLSQLQIGKIGVDVVPADRLR